jgi:hypothetical protein
MTISYFQLQSQQDAITVNAALFYPNSEIYLKQKRPVQMNRAFLISEEE